MNIYPAKLVRIVNGATIKCSINLGFAVWLHNVRIHLAHIICPTGNNGVKATDELIRILPEDFMLTLHQVASENEGKFIATLYPQQKKNYQKEESINARMLESGLVNKYE